MTFVPLIRRDIRTLLLRGTEALSVLAFFIVGISLFPFAFGNDPAALRAASGGIVWILVLLAGLLAQEAIWHRDYEDGVFDLLSLSGVPAAAIVASKMLSHWLVSGLPLLLAAPVGLLMLGLPVHTVLVVWLSLIPGTLYASSLGGFGALLTLGARKPGALMLVLVLPLYVPMLVLGVLAADAALAVMPAKAYVLLQLSLFCATGIPFVFAGGGLLSMHVRSS